MQDLMNTINYLDSFAIENFKFPSYLPLHIHCKNSEGKYVNCNDKVMRDVGFTNKNDFIGITDYEIGCLGENEALSFIQIDKQVIKTGKKKFFIQKVTLLDKKEYIALNHKLPIYSRSKVKGVFSYGLILQSEEIFGGNFNELSQLTFSKSPLLANLTKRQKDCLYWLSKGYGIKQISIKLSISSRTVEHYLEAAKVNLNCHTKHELIEKISVILL